MTCEHKWNGCKCRVCGKTRDINLLYGCPECGEVYYGQEPMGQNKLITISPYYNADNNVVCPHCGSAGRVKWTEEYGVIWTVETGKIDWQVIYKDGSSSFYTIRDCEKCGGRLTNYIFNRKHDDQHKCRQCGAWKETAIYAE